MYDAMIQALAMWVAHYKNLYACNGLSGVMKSFIEPESLNIYKKDFIVDVYRFNDRRYLLENNDKD